MSKIVFVVCCGFKPPKELHNFLEKTFAAMRIEATVKMFRFSPETLVEKIGMLFFMGDVCPWHSFYLMGNINKAQLDSVETLVKDKLPKNLANSVKYINPCEAVLNSVKPSLISSIYVPEEYIVFDKEVSSTEDSNPRKRSARSPPPTQMVEKKPKAEDDIISQPLPENDILSQPLAENDILSQPKAEKVQPPPTSPPDFEEKTTTDVPKEDIVSPEVATDAFLAEFEDGELPPAKDETPGMKIRKTLKDRIKLTVQTDPEEKKKSPFDQNDAFIPLRTGTPKSRDLRDLIDKPLRFYESPSSKVSSRDQIDGIYRGGYVHPSLGVINFFWMREICLDGNWIRPSGKFVKSIENDLYLPWNSYFTETPSNIDFDKVIDVKMFGIPAFRFDKTHRMLFI